jgi:hypothetical protein
VTVNVAKDMETLSSYATVRMMIWKLLGCGLTFEISDSAGK